MSSVYGDISPRTAAVHVSNILAIANKELRSYFNSPIAYAVIGFFAFAFGFMFWVFLLSVFGTVAVAVNRERHREHRRGAGHVVLHPDHGGGGLERETARIEGDALADQS